MAEFKREQEPGVGDEPTPLPFSKKQEIKKMTPKLFWKEPPPETHTKEGMAELKCQQKPWAGDVPTLSPFSEDQDGMAELKYQQKSWASDGPTLSPFSEDQEFASETTKERLIYQVSSFDLARTDLRPLASYKELPQSIYGAAMMAAIRCSQRHGPSLNGVAASVVLTLILNAVGQVYVLFCCAIYITGPAVVRVNKLYEEYQAMVWPDHVFSQEGWDTFPHQAALCQLPFSQPTFCMALLLIWTGTCWVDLKESLSYMQLWLRLGEPRGARSVDIMQDDDFLVAKSASRTTKLLVVTFVLLPKVAIACILWWLGARWLAATPSFQDLVLNAVALAFITELDELIYKVAMPEDVMALVDMYKLGRPEEVQEGVTPVHRIFDERLFKLRDARFCRRIVHMLASISFVTLLPAVYMGYLQGVIVDYRWDVQEVCTDFVSQYNR